jgi:UDP-N-acetylmuramoyl-L-alanyl-D-glutamate--2,6-diaminopimelate ligase
MGLRAWEGADIVVATSDNPRSEDPERILDEALSALPKDATSPGGRVFRIPERAAAIRLATLRADPDDVVLIAGKGHETTQDVGGVRHPFDDRLHAAAALESRA